MCDDSCVRFYGALKSPSDPDDFVFERIACSSPQGFYFAELPAEIDLRRMWREPRDQGVRSTCAAFAGAVIKEIHERKDRSFDRLMSPEFIYFHRENKPGGGMYGRNVFQILQKIGCVPEEDYPYRDDETAPRPDDELYSIAAQYRIANYARVTTVDGLKRALLELGPCYIQLPIYSMNERFWKASDGTSIDGANIVGGHALVVVGYTTAGFLLVNSWGSAWGDDGTVILPFEDWPLHWECWASMDETTNTSPVCVPKRRGTTNTVRGRARVSWFSLKRPRSSDKKKVAIHSRSHSSEGPASRDAPSVGPEEKCNIM